MVEVIFKTPQMILMEKQVENHYTKQRRMAGFYLLTKHIRGPFVIPVNWTLWPTVTISLGRVKLTLKKKTRGFGKGGMGSYRWMNTECQLGKMKKWKKNHYCSLLRRITDKYQLSLDPGKSIDNLKRTSEIILFRKTNGHAWD